jgi:tetratricopeptide (TPR) repeat protein
MIRYPGYTTAVARSGKALIIACAAAPVLCLFPAASPGVTISDATALKLSYQYYLGLYREIGEGEPQTALKAYSDISNGPYWDTELGGEALVREGICFEKLGNENEALNYYNKVIKDFSDKAHILEKAFGGMVRFYARLKPALERQEELARLVNEGIQQAELGDYENAKEKYRKALYIDPDNHELQLQMASTSKKLGRYEEAIFYYNLAATSGLYTNVYQFQKDLAECYKNTGNIDSAIHLWLRFLENEEVQPADKKQAAFELELLYEAKEYPDTGKIPWKLKSHLAMGESLTRNGKYREAAKTYVTAKTEFPNSYLPTYRMAIIFDYLFDGMNNTKRALRYYEATLEEAPLLTAQRLRCRLAILYESLGNLEKAAYFIDQYFSKDVRPVENDHALRNRIRKRRMWERVRTMRKGK